MQGGEPTDGAGFRLACEDSRGPGVGTGTRLGVPRSRWTGTMQQQPELGIDEDGSRHTAAAMAPALSRPGLRAPVLANLGNAYLQNRPRREALPDLPPRAGIQGDDP